MTTNQRLHNEEQMEAARRDFRSAWIKQNWTVRLMNAGFGAKERAFVEMENWQRFCEQRGIVIDDC